MHDEVVKRQGEATMGDANAGLAPGMQEKMLCCSIEARAWVAKRTRGPDERVAYDPLPLEAQEAVTCKSVSGVRLLKCVFGLPRATQTTIPYPRAGFRSLKCVCVCVCPRVLAVPLASPQPRRPLVAMQVQTNRVLPIRWGNLKAAASAADPLLCSWCG